MNSQPTPSKFWAWVQVHVAVFLFGFTGILGDLIELPSLTLVWWRMLITAVSLAFFPKVLKDVLHTPRKELLKMMGIGSIVAAHWVLFFASIKLTGPTVALACLATAPFFTALVEPLFLRQKIKGHQPFLGLMVIPGVIIIQQSDGVNVLGMVLAFASALGAAVFSVLNKTLVDRHRPVTMTFVELGSGALLLTFLLPLVYGTWEPDARFFPVDWEWLYLGVLALVCTSFAYLITLKALKVLPAFSINLSINLEPIYTILLAAWILKEYDKLQPTVYFGAAIIILSVFLNVIWGWWRDRKKAE